MGTSGTICSRIRVVNHHLVDSSCDDAEIMGFKQSRRAARWELRSESFFYASYDVMIQWIFFILIIVVKDSKGKKLLSFFTWTIDTKSEGLILMKSFFSAHLCS